MPGKFLKSVTLWGNFSTTEKNCYSCIFFNCIKNTLIRSRNVHANLMGTLFTDFCSHFNIFDWFSFAFDTWGWYSMFCICIFFGFWIFSAWRYFHFLNWFKLVPKMEFVSFKKLTKKVQTLNNTYQPQVSSPLPSKKMQARDL